MKNPILYYVKSTYGNDRMYVADPAIAQAIATLTGQKTIDWKHVKALETLGFTFSQILPPGARPNYGRTVMPAIPALDFAALLPPTSDPVQ